MKKLLVGLLTLGSISAFAQSADLIAVDSDGQTDKEEAVFAIGEEKTITDENVDVSVLHSNEQGEPLSYLIKKNNGSIKILGVVDNINQASGIINAYAGFQTMFGVNAGLTLFKTIDIGVHARSNSLNHDGMFYTSVTKTGFHGNIKFRPVSVLEVYAGMRWNKYSSNLRGFDLPPII